jgi:Multiubiquitin
LDASIGIQGKIHQRTTTSNRSENVDQTEQQQEAQGPAEGHEDGQHEKETEIIVNGRPKTVEGKEISYDRVVPLGLDPVPTGPNVVITVTYSDARGPLHAGTLTAGHSVEIRKGTRFNVKATDKS